MNPDDAERLKDGLTDLQAVKVDQQYQEHRRSLEEEAELARADDNGMVQRVDGRKKAELRRKRAEHAALAQEIQDLAKELGEDV
jgi:hypothetical protein